MACYEAEQAIAAYFHANRAMRKRKPQPGEARIAAALLQRARQEDLERAAERHAWEVAYEQG